MNLPRKLETQSPQFWGCVGCGLALLIGVGDYWTTPEPILFYLLPVLLAARYGGLKSGLVVAFVSALTWLGVDIGQGRTYAHPILPYWTIVERIALFILCAVTITRMIAAQRQKVQLTQFIVHDLRSPLTSVLSGLQTLHTLASERRDELEIELVEASLIGSNRLLALVNSLMDSEQIASARIPMRLSAVRPYRLIESAVQQVGLWANQTSISIEIQYDAAGREVVADAGLAERVLVNLLGNAIKSSPPRSVITVRVSPFQSSQLAFSVTDEGPGMTACDAKMVFASGTQVGVRKRAMGENGIGMEFCRMAIEAQKGCLWVESEPGHGTTVTFTLRATSPVEIPKAHAQVH